MIRIVSTVLVAAGLAAAAMPASAQSPILGPSQAPAAGSAREVMVCGADAATRRAFAREHGAAPVFVTADDVLRARAGGEAWSAPRCMTDAEHARLVRLLSQRASL